MLYSLNAAFSSKHQPRGISAILQIKKLRHRGRVTCLRSLGWQAAELGLEPVRAFPKVYVFNYLPTPPPTRQELFSGLYPITGEF